jgi:hypothetical protein
MVFFTSPRRGPLIPSDTCMTRNHLKGYGGWRREDHEIRERRKNKPIYWLRTKAASDVTAQADKLEADRLREKSHAIICSDAIDLVLTSSTACFFLMNRLPP